MNSDNFRGHVVATGSGSDEMKELSLVDLLIPSSVRLAILLELDLRLPAEDMPIKGSNVFLIYKDSIPASWFQVTISVYTWLCMYAHM